MFHWTLWQCQAFLLGPFNYFCKYFLFKFSCNVCVFYSCIFRNKLYIFESTKVLLDTGNLIQWHTCVATKYTIKILLQFDNLTSSITYNENIPLERGNERRHDTQNNDIRYNNKKCNTQHNGRTLLWCVIHVKCHSCWLSDMSLLYVILLNFVMLSVVMLSDVAPNEQLHPFASS